MLFVTNGLVIRSVDYKDSDKILTVLTSEHGRLTVSAKGSRSRSSKLISATQLFAYSEMVLFENRGRFSLNDAQTKELFPGISKDIEKMALGSYFAEILGSEEEQNRINPDVLRLGLNCLFALSVGRYSDARIKAAFELRFAALCGYRPSLGSCPVCGKTAQNPVIDMEAGLLRCFSCQSAWGAYVCPMDGAAVRGAQYILNCDIKKILSYEIPPPSMALLADFTEKYLSLKLEKHFKTLSFYKGLI